MNWVRTVGNWMREGRTRGGAVLDDLCPHLGRRKDDAVCLWSPYCALFPFALREEEDSNKEVE